MRFDVITLFPEMVNSVAEYGVTSRAEEKGIITLNCINPRDYAKNKHRTVDDRPYGGGPGMVMRADVLLSAIRDVKQKSSKLAEKNSKKHSKVIYLSPQGKKVNQVMIRKIAKEFLDKDSSDQGLVLLCGRYEGLDERVIEMEVDEEWSIGDYVLSGGELGAMVLIDAITRLLPGVLGHELSAEQDSFSEEAFETKGYEGLLDCPHYTRPEKLPDESGNKQIPAILKSGNHAEIAKWRRMQSLGRTYQRRPDLITENELSKQDQKLLKEFLRQQ